MNFKQNADSNGSSRRERRKVAAEQRVTIVSRNMVDGLTVSRLSEDRDILPPPRSCAADRAILMVPQGWDLFRPVTPRSPTSEGRRRTLDRPRKARPQSFLQKRRLGSRGHNRSDWCELEIERATRRIRQTQRVRCPAQDQAQAEYVEDFLGAVESFLAFHQTHLNLAQQLARAVTDSATPVGSGTVAAERIPVERRAEAAVIASLRHQTTAYDSMPIPRVKGRRRQVRKKLLAQRSHELLDGYRRGLFVAGDCPLKTAVERASGLL